ncbi:MAG: hypothetical protein ACR2P3_09335, partial [Geminicoccaceae bacterium]
MQKSIFVGKGDRVDHEKIRSGHIISQSIRLSGHYFLTFAPIVILLHLPIAALTWLLPAADDAEAEDLQSFESLLAPFLDLAIWIIFYSLIEAIIAVVIVGYLRDSSVGLGNAIKISLAALGRIITTGLLSWTLILLGLFALIVPGLIVWIMLMVVIPVTVI